MGTGGMIAASIDKDLKEILEFLQEKDKKPEDRRFDKQKLEEYINRYNNVLYGLAKDFQQLLSAKEPDLYGGLEIIQYRLLEFKFNNYKKISSEDEKQKASEKIKDYLKKNAKSDGPANFKLPTSVTPTATLTGQKSSSSGISMSGGITGGGSSSGGGESSGGSFSGRSFKSFEPVPYTPPSRDRTRPVKDGNIYDSVDNI